MRDYDTPQDLIRYDIVGDTDTITDRSCAVVWEPWEGASIIRIEDLDEDDSDEPSDRSAGASITIKGPGGLVIGIFAQAGPPDGPKLWEDLSQTERDNASKNGWNQAKWNSAWWVKKGDQWTYSQDVFDWISNNATAILSAVGTALTVASGVVSFIPGIGTAAGVVLGAAGALALGAPIDDIAIAAAAGAVPGGQLAKTAFMSGAHIADALARGKAIDAAALEGARGALESSGLTGTELDAALAAFDAGAALAQGKALQDAGFAAAKDLVPGDGLGAQAVAFAQRAADAAAQKKPIEQYLEEEAAADVKAALPAIAQQTGKALADVAAKLPDTVVNLTSSLMSKIAANPDMANWSSQDIADALGVPEPAARIARALIDVANGKVSIRQDRYDSLMAKLKPVAITQNVQRTIAANQTINQAHGIMAKLGGTVASLAAMSNNPLRIAQIAAARPSPAQVNAASHMVVARAIAGQPAAQQFVSTALARASTGDPTAQVAARNMSQALKLQQLEVYTQYYLKLKAARMMPVGRAIAADRASGMTPGWYHYSGATSPLPRSTFGVG